MDLMQNPFYVLEATTRDNRSRIIELADERSLLLDSNLCMEARSELTTPRKRLTAEVTWLPGVAPKRVNELMEMLQTIPETIFTIKELNPLSRVNIFVAMLSRVENYTVQNIVTWILEIAQEFEKISSDEVLSIINEDRTVSGFSEVYEVADIEEELEKQRKYYRNVFRCALDTLLSIDLVRAITSIVDKDTNNGENAGSTLVYDLVDLYEVEAQPFLNKEAENIEKTLKSIRDVVSASHNELSLAKAIRKMDEVVRNWDKVAQPIQLSTKSKGLDHDASRRIALIIRDVAVYLFNKHDKLKESQKITKMLQNVFAEVIDIAELSADDANALADIAQQRVDDEQLSAKWAREITYEVERGLIFKDKFRISPSGIEWKGVHLSLDSITKIRWGGTRRAYGEDYKVFCGANFQYILIDLKNTRIFLTIIDKIWKAVGVRLLVELINSVRSGQKIRFGTCFLTDFGFEIKRIKFLESDECEFCPWAELRIWNENGNFCIGKHGDKTLTADLSYLEIDNVHVLEAAIRMFFEKGGNRLSTVLQS